MKEYIKKMCECNQKVADTMHEFVNALVEMVKAHGGFLELQNKDHDKIYGYALDGEFDELKEFNMLALMLNEENQLMCFLSPKFVGVKVIYTKEDMLDKNNEDMWYFLDGTDGALYSWATLVDMMEIIDEYDE